MCLNIMNLRLSATERKNV